MWSKEKDIKTRESKWPWEGKSGHISTKAMQAQYMQSAEHNKQGTEPSKSIKILPTVF